MIVLIIRPAPTRLAHPYRAIPFRLIWRTDCTADLIVRVLP
jgi:hypothetical protein